MLMESRFDIIIVGAGAAGMMAAIAASDGSRKILLVEKMEQPGRKLRITGKGRCNLTNTAPIRDFITHIAPDGRFLRNAFSVFFNTELMDFFESRGVPLVVERGNRVFPKSGKSLDIFLAMIKAVESDRNIKILKNNRITDILTYEGRVSGVSLQNGGLVHCSSLIMATGGLSYPATGSTGDGYGLLRKLGHSIVEPVPALVPLVCDEKIPDELAGFTLKNVELSLFRHDGKKICSHFGELTFTPDGIGGPITLSASRTASRLLVQGETLNAKIDLKPALNEEVLDKKLITDLNANGTRVLKDAMRLWLPAEIIPFALSRTKIEHFKRLNQINAAERKKLLQLLKGLTLTITGTRGFEEAIITQGGVALNEVNPKTFESKLVKGLYIVGELLDLDADTGGYNLQIAFSTGWVAGKKVES
ncbi:MAG: NAD(P)/FAD-dependent oxidoreductase [Bacteroidales bacterium]|nr:NAD(P)/FAD-dependent oxidoreductase [Bacteroidales bacterium]